MAKLTYNEKMKRLRPFVNFDHDLRKNLQNTLSASDKSRITRYYSQLSPRLAFPGVIYRPRRKDHIKVAREKSGMTLPRFTAFLIPSPTGRGRVTIKKGAVVIKRESAEALTLLIDPVRLVKETRAYLVEILTPGKYYIANSGYDWNVSNWYEQFIDDLDFKINVEYKQDIERVKAATGDELPFEITIIEVQLKKQTSIDEYRIRRKEAQLKKMRDNKNAARRGKRNAKKKKAVR
jgi:hypothetical protein